MFVSSKKYFPDVVPPAHTRNHINNVVHVYMYTIMHFSIQTCKSTNRS